MDLPVYDLAHGPSDKPTQVAIRRWLMFRAAAWTVREFRRSHHATVCPAVSAVFLVKSGLSPVEVLLAAFLRADLELIEQLKVSEEQVARFLGRSYAQPSPAVATFMDRQFEEVGARLSVAAASFALCRPGGTAGTDGLVVTVLFATASPAGEPHPLGIDDVEPSWPGWSPSCSSRPQRGPASAV